MTTQQARTLRKNLTEAEQRLWQQLRRQQLAAHKFRRQFPIGPYIVDFVCLKARLIIELDGGQHMEQAAYDHARDQWLEKQRFRVMRFWNDEVFEQMEAVLGRIAAALQQPPPPNPLPPGEGGPNCLKFFASSPHAGEGWGGGVNGYKPNNAKFRCGISNGTALHITV